MIFYLIIGVIILICFIIIAIIIFSKFSQLSSLDLEAMKAHKQKQIKVSIIEERLERKFKEISDKLSVWFKPLKEKIVAWFIRIYNKIRNLEKKYQDEKNLKIVKSEDKETLRQKVSSLITEAEELAKQEKIIEAEKKYIEAISLDKQSIDAYKGLGEIYLLKKDYEHALETFEFVKQINPNDDIVWRQLGGVHQFLNNEEQSLKCYKRAVDLMPNNPKNLDLLIEISIKAKDVYLAKNTLSKLEEVNPENNKLEDYKKQIEEL